MLATLLLRLQALVEVASACTHLPQRNDHDGHNKACHLSTNVVQVQRLQNRTAGTTASLAPAALAAASSELQHVHTSNARDRILLPIDVLVVSSACGSSALFAVGSTAAASALSMHVPHWSQAGAASAAMGPSRWISCLVGHCCGSGIELNQS